MRSVKVKPDQWTCFVWPYRDGSAKLCNDLSTEVAHIMHTHVHLYREYIQVGHGIVLL